MLLYFVNTGNISPEEMHRSSVIVDESSTTIVLKLKSQIDCTLRLDERLRKDSKSETHASELVLKLGGWSTGQLENNGSSVQCMQISKAW